ncbi:hypothetical protein Tco_1022078 [Tanacetum coccineum]
MKGLFECKASESNIRRIRVKDIVKEVEDYLETYSSVGMDISCSKQLAQLFTKVWAGSFQDWMCIKSQGQIQGFPGDLSLGIAFSGDMSPRISETEKLEWDSFPGDILERHRRAHIVSVKQLSATVDGFPGQHVARDTKIN